jgi:DNA-directed RNA polymerase subunit E'
MFMKYKVMDNVSISPLLFGEDLAEAAKKQLMERYLNTYDEEMGYIIKIDEIAVDPVGKVLSEDGSSYHKVKFTAYTFKPILNEIIEGEVVEITTFGLFIRIGPIDALLHISQIMDDLVVVDTVQGMVRGQETGKTIRVGDPIRARVIAISPPKGIAVLKVGLTCRGGLLGKVDWIIEEIDSRGVKEIG